MTNLRVNAQMIAAQNTQIAPSTSNAPIEAATETETKTIAQLTPPGLKKRTTFLSLPAELRQQILKQSIAPNNLTGKRKSTSFKAVKCDIETGAEILKEAFQGLDNPFVGASVVGEMEADIDFVVKGLIDVILEDALIVLGTHEKRTAATLKLLDQVDEVF